MEKKLVVEIPYAGLGDHLFHSHLPRIAKQTGAYDRVYISEKSSVRNKDYRHIVWERNPFIDGFIDEAGLTCNLKELVEKAQESKTENLLDLVMFEFGLEDNKRWHEPEVHYKPKFIEDYNKKVFDPNFISWVGQIDKEDMMRFLKKENIDFEAIMNIRNEKALFIPNGTEDFIETKTISDFCDLIYSASKLFCLTSGTATLAASLNKPATVFYGAGQGSGFRHSKLHTYKKVNRTPVNSLKDSLRSTLNFFKSEK